MGRGQGKPMIAGAGRGSMRATLRGWLAVSAALGLGACSGKEEGRSPAGDVAGTAGNMGSPVAGGSGTAGSGATTSGGSSSLAGAAGSAGNAGAGNGGVAAGSGLDGTKRLDALSEAERATLCDLLAAKYGGYDHEIQCTTAKTISSGYANQAECLADWPTSCAMTVASYEICVSQISCAGFPAACGALSNCTK